MPKTLGKVLLSAAVVVMTAACAMQPTRPATAAGEPAVQLDPAALRPNIVLILADDLGMGQIGAYGARHFHTPEIDALAASGTRFTDTYAGGPVCSPSRVSMMTGRDSFLLGGNTNALKLEGGDRTFVHLLQAAGYDTMLIGKYGIGSDIGVNDPQEMGFDHWIGLLDNISAHRQYPDHIFRDRSYDLVAPNLGRERGLYAQELFTREAENFIAAKRDTPFFLLLAYTTPHAELAAPERFVATYRGRFDETRYNGRTGADSDDAYARFYPEPIEQPNAVMAGMVAALDEYVGRIVDAVAARGIERETLILFTSDNGPHEEGGARPSQLWSAGGLRGLKRDLFDGGIRVPMIAYWPGRVRAGATSDEPWAFNDLLPTFSKLAGISTDAVQGIRSNGVSVVPLLLDNGAELPERVIYWEFASLISQGNARREVVVQAARSGNWKAVRYGIGTPVQIYDMTNDDGEQRDIARGQTEMAERYRTLFDGQLD